VAVDEKHQVSTALETFGCWIDGEMRMPDGPRLVSVNPATGEPWATAVDATEDVVHEAVDAARRAFASPAWSGLTPTRRGRLMRDLADAIRAESESLASIETRDNGKVLYQSRAEMGSTADWLEFYAGTTDKIDGATKTLAPNLIGTTFHEPLGVVGAIAPFNAPIVLSMWKIAPALATGNTVVLKPSPDTPISTLNLGRLATQVGFPDGVLNVVTGGAEAGRALVADPDVAMISFTGDSGTARKIAAAATGRMARVSVEGGGKSPHIVFGDANLDQALVGAIAGVFTHAGQTCVAGSRLLVEASIFDEFVDGLVRRAAALRVGDPLSTRSHIGSLSSERQFERVSGYIASAREEGAEVLTGGGRPDDPELQAGYFFRPTVIVNARNDMRVCQEEVFGPVVVAMPFESEEEAIAIANDVQFGLGAGVWTNDIRRANRVARGVQAGTVWVNNYRTTHWQAPFGGYKQSGFGRENGVEALQEFVQTKSIITDYGTTTADPFDF
jgi:acyl-CoA reductase-like NAD-dependent aldehyde dehydrogenase